MVSWNATCWAPVAASPESWESALPRLAPVRPKMVTKSGGSAPPLLKKLLSAVATLRWLMLRPSGPAPRCRARQGGGEVQDHVGVGVAQVRGEADRQVARRQSCRTCRCARPRPTVWCRCARRSCRTRTPPAPCRRAWRCRRRHVGGRAVRGIDLHEVERARLEREIAADRHRAGRVAGSERAAAVDRGRAYRAGAGEQGTAVDGHRRVGDRAVHDQRAGIDRGRAGIGVDRGEDGRARAVLLELAAPGDGLHPVPRTPS